MKCKPVFVIFVGIAAAGGMFWAKRSMYLTNMKMLYAAGMWNMRAIFVIKVTGLLCICMILGLLFIYLTANLAKQGWIFYFITFPLVFAAMMAQADLDIWTLFLAVFHLGTVWPVLRPTTQPESGQQGKAFIKMREGQFLCLRSSF